MILNIALERERLKKILVDFHTLAHVRTVIYDSDFNKIAAYPERKCDFCELMKQDARSRALCKSDDHNACRICSKRNSLYMYECHAGLVEAVAPIRMNDLNLGYIMFGQVRRKERSPDEICTYAARFVPDTQQLADSVQKIKVRGEKEIRAIAGVMEACTCYLLMEQLIKLDSNNQIYKLSDYITNHLSDDLSVDRLCAVLQVSRVALYELAHRYYGMSIAKYIRKKRAQEAAQLLREGQISVKAAALQVGFFDGNYFSKIFKQEFGVTPSDYKKGVNDSK